MNETFGQWLERKRIEAGFNQTELAQRSRMTKSTISLYENDKVEQPRLRQLEKIAKALGISFDEIRLAAGNAPHIDDDTLGLTQGLNKLTPERQEIAKRQIKAIIDALTDRDDHDFDYIGDDE